MQYKPTALIILDGWGIRENAAGNAVVLANTPNYDKWNRNLERTVLDASGEPVGLPDGQMGNSEVGHLNLGAGRIVYQDLTRINLAIREGLFAETAAFQQTIVRLKENGGKLHLVGLFGEGGVHSHSDHMYALLDLANANEIDPILHVITDGRDTPPESSRGFADKLTAYQQDKNVTVASVCGRYYTMDRDKRWERTQLGYDVIAKHKGKTAVSLQSALEQAHADGVTDEFILPVAIDCDRDVTVQSGDAIIFYNFRADRMRQIVPPFMFADFEGFARDFIDDVALVTITNYVDTFTADIAFPETEIKNVLAEVVSKAGLTQFHAAETEKYAHVTYFFNGGGETPFEGETRHMQPSPKVATYDLQPEMSARPLTEAVLQRISDENDAFILVNFANPDMVGHTGDLEAAIKAVETVDECAGRLVQAIVAKGGVACVTADHGNCDRMIDLATGNPHTYHTTQPVAFFVIGHQGYLNLTPRGKLADVAPTILELMGLEQPEEMSGQSLIWS